MQSAFRKLSRVGSLTGGTKWYLSEDCLLAAKRVLYAVEYRRFYLRDLESIVVWPSRLWVLRPIIPGALLVAIGIWLILLRRWEIGALLWRWSDLTTGAIFAGVGVAWVLLELALGPTAKARIQTTGGTVDLPIVKRIRRANRVLAKVDAAVRATRVSAAEPANSPAPVSQTETPSLSATSESAPVSAPIRDLT